jgi:hypothetical protein
MSWAVFWAIFSKTRPVTLITEDNVDLLGLTASCLDANCFGTRIKRQASQPGLPDFARYNIPKRAKNTK